MKPRTSPIVLGFIWGIFSMMLSFAVFSVFASLKVVFIGFPLFSNSVETQYILIGAVFLLSVMGAIGAGIMPRLIRLGGLFLLLSCIGVAALLFVPVIMQSFSFEPLGAYGITLSPLALLIADFSMVLLTALGITGGILSFIPKRDRKALKPPITVAAEPQVPPAAMPSVSVSPAAVQPAVQPDIIHADTPPTDIVPPPTDINLMNLE